MSSFWKIREKRIELFRCWDVYLAKLGMICFNFLPINVNLAISADQSYVDTVWAQQIQSFRCCKPPSKKELWVAGIWSPSNWEWDQLCNSLGPILARDEEETARPNTNGCNETLNMDEGRHFGLAQLTSPPGHPPGLHQSPWCWPSEQIALAQPLAQCVRPLNPFWRLQPHAKFRRWNIFPIFLKT